MTKKKNKPEWTRFDHAERRFEFDHDKSLNQLENHDWGDPGPECGEITPLVVRCHDLRKKPVRDLQPSEIITLLNQKIAPGYAVALGLEIVLTNPMAGYFPHDEGAIGDLFRRILTFDDKFWEEHTADFEIPLRFVDGELKSMQRFLTKTLEDYDHFKDKTAL